MFNNFFLDNHNPHKDDDYHGVNNQSSPCRQLFVADNDADKQYSRQQNINKYVTQWVVDRVILLSYEIR